MATYYVRTVANGGSDAAAGTSAGAAWATIGKALGAAGISSGDTVYVGAGTYREVVAVAMTSAVAETFVIADVTGEHTGDAGEVIWTAYTTDDTTTPSTSPTIDLAQRDFLTFQGFTIFGGNLSTGSCVKASVSSSVNITFQDCTFYAGATSTTLIDTVGLVDTASNWTLNRCRFFLITGNGAVQFTVPSSATADYDVNYQITNCFFHSCGGANVYVNGSGGATGFYGYGVDMFNCTSIGAGTIFRVQTANHSSTNPSTIQYCVACSSGNALSAATLGQITENYNRFMANSAHSNVTAGANSIAGVTHAMMVSLGQEAFLGKQPRQYFSPMVGSPLLGFTNVTSPTTDLLNRPRPAGGSITNAAGALERHDTATKETSVTDAGGVAIKITGPGDQDIQIPVAAAATVITLRCRYDTNHATTNKPQAILLANGEIGVATETETGAAAVDTWETLTFSSFTPTAAGVVTIRLVSRSAAANGVAYFDTVTVA